MTRRGVLAAGLGFAGLIKCGDASASPSAPAHSPTRPPNESMLIGWPGGGAGRNRDLTYCADEPPAANPDKITQAAAEYQPTPKGMFSCGVCTFFIKPKSCKVVEGDVSATGWCKLFDMVD